MAQSGHAVVVVSGEHAHATTQLAVVSSPQNVRHRTLSRDLEDTPLLFQTSPRCRALPHCELSESPPATPRSPRPLRALAPAGAAALIERKALWLARPRTLARAWLAAACKLVFVVALALACFCASWGIGSPSHLACRGPARVSADATSAAPFMAVSACDGDAPRFAAPTLRLNDVQVIGSHNSYHLQPWPLALSPAWRYTHASLAAQLDAGVRSLELDVHYDPLLRAWSVYHEPWVDPRSSCACLSDCLRSVVEWSDARGGDHTLLVLVIEPKFNIDARNPFRNGATSALLQLQADILAVVPRGRVLTPAAVQGGAASLAAAVTGACGWPGAAETRGGFLFLLDVWAENAAAGVALRSVPLPVQLFFLRATESDPSAVPTDAVIVEPEACGCAHGFDQSACSAAFGALVRAGFLVRTSIGSAACAQHETPQRSAAAAAAGVQLLVTDFVGSAALPCGKERTECCVRARSSGAPCTLDEPVTLR